MGGWSYNPPITNGLEGFMTAILARLLTALCVLGLLFSLASCCCAGGSDSDNNGDTDIVGGIPHNEGGGNGV
jgi:hypothetical protein